MATTYLTRSVSSTGNRRKWTWSGWLKRGRTFSSGSDYIFSSNNGSNQYSMLAFASDTLRYYDYTSSFQSEIKTNRLFRDISAWYHIVITYDSAQGTASNRIKFYVNGVQETSLQTSTYPSQNNDSYMNYSGVPFQIGRETGTNNYNGIMSHIHFTDGYIYDASAFGETDSTTGEWKIKTDPTFTLGTNGFSILKDGNTITDQSSNSNNFSLGGGTLTKTEDNPSNVFATLNPLVKQGSTLSNGNNTSAYGSGSWKSVIATLGIETGKFYYEAKLVSGSAGQLGVASSKANGGYATTESGALGNSSGCLSVNFGDGSVQTDGGSGGTAQGFTVSAGDIVGCAVDMTNSKIYWSKNGVWGNSSNPATGANATTIATGLTNFLPLLPAISVNNSTISTNFGNGYFGTTAVSSAGTNASGIGIFEYDVPTGFTALSTKGLNL